MALNRWGTQATRNTTADAFAYTSYKHQCDQHLLDRLSEAIYVLKLEAQGQLEAHGFTASDARAQREHVAALLSDLAERVRLLTGASAAEPAALAFTGLADRFVRVNPADVGDRLDEVDRLRRTLEQGQDLGDRHFELLDHLQSLLEEEAAEGMRGLYQL